MIYSLIGQVYTDKKKETKRKLANYIRGVFRYHVRRGSINFNPAKRVGFGKKADKQLKAMTRSEVRTLLKHLKGQNHDWYPIIRVVYELGLRTGEAIALQWDQINFEDNTVLISRAYCSKSKEIKPYPKGYHWRTIPMSKSLSSFLKHLKVQDIDTKFVLGRNSTLKRGEAAKILRQVQRELGIPETNFHSLRASFITHLLLENVPVTKVQQMVGHRYLKTTQLYVRTSASDLRGSTDVLLQGFDED